MSPCAPRSMAGFRERLHRSQTTAWKRAAPRPYGSGSTGPRCGHILPILIKAPHSLQHPPRPPCARRDDPCRRSITACSFILPSSVSTRMMGRLWRIGHLEVVRVVRGRNLHRAGAELLFHVFVRHDGNGPVYDAAISRFCPLRCAYRSSSGCTATAVSPSMVSGRVVATVMPSPPSSAL